MSRDWPDLVVGVDFGTTGTAVAYARPTENVVYQLRKWSDDPNLPEKDKVPTMIAFEGNNVAAWGLGVGSLNPEEIPNFCYYKLFKPLFDSDNSTHAAEAERCVRTFLMELRIYLEQALRNEQPLKRLDWETCRTKYVFSYPTTWDQHTQRRFSSLLQDAGYLKMDDQPMITSLDEAQASIINFLCGHNNDSESIPKSGDLILVADIGGGTSDVAIFKVLSMDGREPELFCEVKDEGKYMGSTYVDDGFKESLREKLKITYQGHLDATPGAQKVTEETMKTFVDTAIFHLEHDTVYLNQKHTYGMQAAGGRTQNPNFDLWVPDLLSIMSRSPGKPLNQKTTIPIQIPRAQFFEEPFNEQCTKIWNQCEEQMEKLGQGRTITHVVLAGGFGSSPYAVSKLSENFRDHYRSKDARVVEIRHAQLAVSRGLVQNELRNIYGNPGWVYPATCSYGIQKGGDKDGIKWFLEKGKDVKVPRAFKVTRHVDISPNNFDLHLVRTAQAPTWGLIAREDKKILWRKSIHRVEDVDIDKWVKSSLPAKLKADFSFKSSKTAELTIKGKMSRDAIAFTLEHAGAEHGRPLIVLQTWHDTPKLRNAKAKTSRPGLKYWTWGLNEQIAAVGVGFAAVAAALAGVALWNDLRKKEDPKGAAPVPTQADVACSSVTATTTDVGGQNVEGITVVVIKDEAQTENNQRSV